MMARFICYEEKGDAGVTREAYDAQAAAEDYAESAWWGGGCERANRMVYVEDKDGRISVWEVEGEPTMVFHAIPHEERKAD